MTAQYIWGYYMGRGLMELEIRDANAKEILPENEIRFFFSSRLDIWTKYEGIRWGLFSSSSKTMFAIYLTIPLKASSVKQGQTVNKIATEGQTDRAINIFDFPSVTILSMKKHNYNTKYESPVDTHIMKNGIHIPSKIQIWTNLYLISKKFQCVVTI